MAKKDKGRGGLTPQTFGGLNASRYKKKSGFGDRLQLKQGDSADVQFVAPISDQDQWKEISQHQFQDRGKWNYVPCLGDDCPLCDDDDRDVSKTTYRFFTNAYSFKDKKVVIVEGPKDLSGRIARKFGRCEKRKKGSFLKKTWEISKLATTPVSYEVEEADRKVVTIDPKQLVDLDAYIKAEAERYFGDDMPTTSGKKESKRTALDDDDDEADEDFYDEEELEEMEWADLKRYAKQLGVKLVDKEGEKRKRPALIRLILKKQDQ